MNAALKICQERYDAQVPPEASEANPEQEWLEGMRFRRFDATDTARIRAAQSKREQRLERNYRNEAAQGREPEGLQRIGNAWEAECRSCGCSYVFDCDAREFDENYSYCGRSDRCIP